MGTDNVLAVAGAAHGSYLLVVLGLLISIPIVVWGSTILLHFAERFPSIIYIGGTVLAATGVKMILSETVVSAVLPQNPVVIALIYVVVVAGIMLAGHFRNQVRRMRAAFRLHAMGRRQFRRSSVSSSKGVVIEKVLLPIDGSNNSITRLLQHSVTAKLLEKAEVPVEPVVGTEASRWERFGVPAGVGAALVAVFIAAD